MSGYWGCRVNAWIRSCLKLGRVVVGVQLTEISSEIRVPCNCCCCCTAATCERPEMEGDTISGPDGGGGGTSIRQPSSSHSVVSGGMGEWVESGSEEQNSACSASGGRGESFAEEELEHPTPCSCSLSCVFWCVLMCLLRWSLRLMCLLRWSLRMKRLEHSGQANRFSPVCIRRWR